MNAATSDNTGIYIRGGGDHVISGNFIHDLLTTSWESTGICCVGDIYATIKGNRITALNVNATTTTVYGIRADDGNNIFSLSLNVQNNQITLSPAADMSTNLYGFYCSGGSFSVVLVNCNSIVIGGIENGEGSSFASQFTGGAMTCIAIDNLFLNFRTGGAYGHYAFGMMPPSYLTITISNNVYAGTGAIAEQFMTFQDWPTNFATWKSYHFDTNSQAGVAGSGNFTSAMFVDAANGDLHLVPGGNPLVNGAGIPGYGVVDDYDGDLRPSGTPTVGADQQPFADISVVRFSALVDGVGSVNFGKVAAGTGSNMQTFTLTNSGNVDLTGLVVSLDGANAPDFSVGTLGSTNLPVGTGSTTFTVTFTPYSLGVSNAAIHITSNVSGMRIPFDIALTGTGVTAAEGWRYQYFGSVANSGNGADTFDYDHDGLPNLIEWACNLNPKTASKLTASAALNGANMEYTYTRNVNALNAGAAFSVEWSDTLGNDWVSTGVSETILSDDGTVQQVKATLPAGSAGHRFVHLKVTAPP